MEAPCGKKLLSQALPLCLSLAAQPPEMMGEDVLCAPLAMGP